MFRVLPAGQLWFNRLNLFASRDAILSCSVRDFSSSLNSNCISKSDFVLNCNAYTFYQISFYFSGLILYLLVKIQLNSSGIDLDQF